MDSSKDVSIDLIRTNSMYKQTKKYLQNAYFYTHLGLPRRHDKGIKKYNRLSKRQNKQLKEAIRFVRGGGCREK